MGLFTPYETYALITGQDFLERARAYEKEYTEVYLKYREFARSQGAVKFFHFRRLVALRFNGDVPPEWTKPRGRTAPSFPKRGTAARAAVMALPSLPDSRDVYGDKILFNYSYDIYSSDGELTGNGIGAFSYRFEPMVMWTPGDAETRKYFLIVTDVDAFCKGEAIKNPQYRYSPELYAWKWPDGLERKTEAEFELAFAQAKVDYENAEKERENDDVRV